MIQFKEILKKFNTYRVKQLRLTLLVCCILICIACAVAYEAHYMWRIVLLTVAGLFCVGAYIRLQMYIQTLSKRFKSDVIYPVAKSYYADIHYYPEKCIDAIYVEDSKIFNCVGMSGDDLFIVKNNHLDIRFSEINITHQKNEAGLYNIHGMLFCASVKNTKYNGLYMTLPNTFAYTTGLYDAALEHPELLQKLKYYNENIIVSVKKDVLYVFIETKNNIAEVSYFDSYTNEKSAKLFNKQLDMFNSIYELCA